MPSVLSTLSPLPDLEDSDSSILDVSLNSVGDIHPNTVLYSVESEAFGILPTGDIIGIEPCLDAPLSVTDRLRVWTDVAVRGPSGDIRPVADSAMVFGHVQSGKNYN